MSENIDLYVYKEFNAKVGPDVDKNGYFGSLKMDEDMRNYPELNTMINSIPPDTKLYTFQEQPSLIPSLANNCLVYNSKNFSPKNIRILDDKQEADEKYIKQRGYKPILLQEYEHVTTKNKVRDNYEYFVTGNYMFISAKTYDSNDDLRLVFHIDSAPSDFPNIIISTGYIVVCSKTSLNTLINKAKTSTSDTVYLATLDTSTGTPRFASRHPLAATAGDSDDYTSLRATGVMYSFYEVAKIFLDSALKPVSLAIIGNNLCLFKYNYRVYFKTYYFDRNTRIIGLIFHWFCGPEIASLTRFYKSELTYDRTVPFVFSNTSYQYSNMYTPLFFTKRYDDLVQGKLNGIREVVQPMSLDINNGNKNVTIFRVTVNDIIKEYDFSASDNSNYYHFSPGNVINKLQNNIPYPLNSNVFIPNVCSADEHFPQALVDSQVIKYINQGDYTIYKCEKGECDNNGNNCSSASWTELKRYYDPDVKPIDTNNVSFSKKLSSFNPNFYAVVPTYVEDSTASDSNPESNPGSDSGSKQDEESSNGFMTIIRALFYSKSSNNEYTFDWAKIAIIAAVLIVIIVIIVFVIKNKSSPF